MQDNLSKVKIPLLEVNEVGYVNDVRRGIARVSGMPSCVYGQLVRFSSGTKGMIIGFNPREVLIIVLGEELGISVGDSVTTHAEMINVPVGEKFLGRIVNALAEPIDGLGQIPAADFFPVFGEAPAVMEREPITEQVLTGTKMIDLILPIGKGQRELIIGDRQTGKSTIALDAIINQKDKNIICIYCWIGGPQIVLKKHIHFLKDKDCLKYTIIASASANTSAAEQYLVPYTASALGEYFMKRGKDVLVVFDDLTKHAWIYRQMSLLLERAPGREAYPGDIFYLHSSLLERAGKLKAERGGGSMTFLPIAETLQGDIAGYIQTNLISITDGQIYVNASLFHEGFKPAIDLGLSVSRIGSRVQSPALKEVSGGLRLEYAQYREMLRLTKLRTRLSGQALEKMRRGKALEQLLVQPNNEPLSLVEEIVTFYAFKRKILEAIPPPQVQQFIARFHPYLQAEDPDMVNELNEKKQINQAIEAKLSKHYGDFFKTLNDSEAALNKDTIERFKTAQKQK
jgi:F-type H+/Na+-transporting ATPase subunit alpha